MVVMEVLVIEMMRKSWGQYVSMDRREGRREGDSGYIPTMHTSNFTPPQ